MSKERRAYLNNRKKELLFIHLMRFLIILLVIIVWELLSRFNIIDTFLFSSPSNIIKTIINLNKANLIDHILTTTYEIVLSFIIGNIIGFIISSILWFNKTLLKILEPYLTIINSLPKVSLGPLIIILFGASTKSIIIMSLLISTIISILYMTNSFNNTDINKINLIKSMGGNKLDIFFRLVVPININNIIDSFKINISMCFVGVIMGEFLVSKKGIGYLINYGSQVFNMNLVLGGIILLVLLTSILYSLIIIITKIKRTD